MNNAAYIGVDIGGTHIACAMINAQTGKITGKIETVAVNSNGTINEILQSWQTAIVSVISQNSTIAGIGVAMPGPFDYKRGISKIEGVQKFDKLFGINLRQAICDMLEKTGITVVFENDANCFALGEFYSGAARSSKRTLVVTLGTGFGSTFLINGQIQQTASNEIPHNGYLYNIPYKDSIADDYFSSRWFKDCWFNMTKETVQGAKEIADLAQQNNPDAKSLFNMFADNFSEFIYPWIVKFNPDTLVIGGNIAKASTLFLNRIESALQNKGINNLQVKICEQWDKASIIGAGMNSKLTELKDGISCRYTEQFLAPDKTKAATPGNYDIYPAFPLGKNKIYEGNEALAAWISQHKAVAIDGYVGVFWDKLVSNLAIELRKTGKTVRWFHTDMALLPSEEIDQMLKPYLGESDSIFGKLSDKDLSNWFDSEKLKKIQPDPDADINIIIGCGATLAGWKAPLIYIDLPKNELQFRMRAKAATNLGIDRHDDNREKYKRFYFADWPALNRHKCNILPKIDLIVDEQRPDNYLFMSGENLRNGLTGMSQNFFRVRPWFEPGAWGGSWMKSRIEGLNKNVKNLAWSFELMVLENGLMFESDDYRLEVSFDFLMFNNYKEVLGDCAERFIYDFPIRFDFLDTFNGGNLSIQCHPRPEYIKSEFGMPFTQDETYYILDCKEQPVVYLGFQKGINPEEFHNALINSQENMVKLDVEKYVQKHPAKKHDFFLIPNGSIHASGNNNLVLEISSAPYIFTFKMYDWLRLDLDGRPRPINIKHAMNNLYFERQGEVVQNELICKPSIIDKTESCTIEHLPTHPKHFYDVLRYDFNGSIEIENKNKCHVWMLVEGESVIIETASGMKQRFNYAETFVIPAAAGSYKITNEGNGNALMVQSFVKD